MAIYSVVRTMQIFVEYPYHKHNVNSLILEPTEEW